MPAAALTPRMRIMVLCEEVVPSEIESGVFNLEGVRQHLFARAFPCRCSLSLFLGLSSTRKGRFQGKVLLVDDNDPEARSLRYVKFLVTFEADNEQVSFFVALGQCVFPKPGSYSFQVWFSAKNSNDVLKAEHSFTVLEE